MTDFTTSSTPHYVAADKIRFRDGFPEKIGGWDSITIDNSNPINGCARSIFSYSLTGNIRYITGTHTNLYSLLGSVLTNITPLVAATTAIANSLDSNFATLGNDPVATVSSSGLATGVASSSTVIENGTFAADTDWIHPDAAWTISGGTLTASGAQTVPIICEQAQGLTTGRTWEIKYTMSGYVAGNFKVFIGDFDETPLRSANGTYTEILVNANPSQNGTVTLWGDAAFNGSIGNVSVKELPRITYTTNDGGFTDFTDITVNPAAEAPPTFGGFSNGANTSPYIYHNTTRKRVGN